MMKAIVNYLCKIVGFVLALVIPVVSFAQEPTPAGTAPDAATIKSGGHLPYAAELNRALFSHNLRVIDSLLSGTPDKARIGSYRRAATVLLENDLDLQMTEKYATIAYELSKEMYAHPSDGYDREIGPSNLSKALELLGSIAAIRGDFARAMQYFTETPDTPRSGSAKMEALYLLTIAHSDKYATVKQKLESKVSSGDFGPEIKTAIQLVYNKEHPGKTDGFEAWYKALKASYKPENDPARTAELAALKAQMAGRPARDFSLFDTEGKQVTLGSLKGKVVVLDFWATWCVPCLASFPAIQHVMDRYKDDHDVVFLFVNTREKNKDIKSWIAKFKTAHNYSFPILLDSDSKVVDFFGSTALPTKVIIDKNGMIQFTTIGYAGDEVLVSELPNMIELAKSAK
ncbi:MAG: TlpA disulfide reductase family protein [Bacteroidota bacterium]